MNEYIEKLARDIQLIACTLSTEIRGLVDNALYEYTRPSVLYRPDLSIDGDQWCALYGSNLVNGVAGFGSTPQEAMQAFDKAWAEEVAGKKQSFRRTPSKTQVCCDHPWHRFPGSLSECPWCCVGEDS